ncbi:sensor histidine kinase [Salegentibacter chungangensis]|uniref:Sensor histidine kinase n=1 Tax=Salegentibacter chungangensis TaxID=1335724 RepID=A0ABW3NPG4_9FLAO
MKTGNLKHLFFYFYKELKLTAIRTFAKKPEQELKKKPGRLALFFEKAGIAAITTLFVYTTFIFLNLGTKMFTREGVSMLSRFNLYELLFAFCFLLVLFWIHSKISQFLERPFFKKTNSFRKSLTEALLVVIATVIALGLINFLPLFLLFPDIDPPAKAIRRGFVVSTIISLFFYYYVERQRSTGRLQAEMLRSARLQKENYQAQLKNLKDQLQPHFLFNSLNVLSSLILKDQHQALEFTQKLSDLYRSFLESGKESLIPLKREIEISRDYCYLLKTRFGKAVQFNFNVPDDQNENKVPPGSLQLLIENAVKHNGSTSKLPLKVDIYQEEDFLIVRNNLKPRKEALKTTRTGLENIKRRYQYLTDRKIEIDRTETEFIAKLPLLKVEDYEHSNH